MNAALGAGVLEPAIDAAMAAQGGNSIEKIGRQNPRMVSMNREPGPLRNGNPRGDPSKAALRSQDAARHGLPVPSHAEPAALSAARGEEHRTENSRGPLAARWKHGVYSRQTRALLAENRRRLGSSARYSTHSRRGHSSRGTPRRGDRKEWELMSGLPAPPSAKDCAGLSRQHGTGPRPSSYDADG